MARAADPSPTGPSELSFLSVDTRTPYVADYPGEDGGQTAHHMLRWDSTSTEMWAWSETASGAIRAQWDSSLWFVLPEVTPESHGNV